MEALSSSPNRPQPQGGRFEIETTKEASMRYTYVPQTGDGDLLFVMEAHHCEAGSRTVGSVMLPDIGITHRCFL